MSIQLFFTPINASIGGLILGISVSGVFLLRGGILGCSSPIRTISSLEFSPWPLALLSGLVAGGGLVVSLLPSAFDTYPDTFTIGRCAASGLLVGLGTALGNGCTSGHGLCGLGRLSIRSFVYVCIFMFTAGLTANLSKVEDALGVVNSLGAGVPQFHTIGELQLAMGLGTAGALAVILALLAMVGLHLKPSHKELNKVQVKPKSSLVQDLARVSPETEEATDASTIASKQLSQLGESSGRERTLFVTLDRLKAVGCWKLALLGLAVEFVAGFAFSIGLAVSGMTQNSKVVGFLSVAFTWDPSLAFVMGVGCFVSLISFQSVLRMQAMDAPACSVRFDLPLIQAWRDARLLVGGVPFGVGWGLSGYCPGPAIVNLVRLTPQSATFNGCMLIGAMLEAIGSWAWARWKTAGEMKSFTGTV